MAQKNSIEPSRNRSGKGNHVRPSVKRKQREDRRRALIAIAAVVIIAALGLAVFFGLKAFQGNGSSAQTASSQAAAGAEAPEQSDESAQAPDDVVESSDASADESPEPSESSVSEEPATKPANANKDDLSWRDADFAVDPNRDTDWNYDSNGRKVVYLTIDDGPSDKTQAVLDILDQYGCKATFFVVGVNPDYYYMIKEAYDRGHTIGMHTYTHDYAYVYSSQQAYFDDLAAIADVVRDQIGYEPCFIRFPGGSSNDISANYTVGIMSALVDEVQARGYQYYDWNVSFGDGSEHTADELVFYATEDATEYENIVMLMHDSETKQATVEALPRVIEYYQERGYTFEAIDRSTFVPHHGTNN